MDEQTLCISPSALKGSIAIPPSKSQSLRALLFALMAETSSQIRRLLSCTDSAVMMRAIQSLGAQVLLFPTHLEVKGGLCPAQERLDAGSSGLVFRFITALAGLLPSPTLLTGDRGRPIIPLICALRQLGAKIIEREGVLSISGPIYPGRATLVGIDSQPVSALLIATSFLDGKSELLVSEPREQPWIEVTLEWLRRLGARIEHEHYRRYWIYGGLSYEGFAYEVPGDFSSAAFALAAALITRSTLTLTQLDFTDSQGDKILVSWLQELGASIEIDQLNGKLTVYGEKGFRGGILDLNLCIDALPILAVLGCFAEGEMRLLGASGARFKESDRIHAIYLELKKMGACIEEYPDGLLVQPSSLRGIQLSSHNDHRIAMSLAVAALGARGTSELFGRRCIDKTYPTFVRDFQQIGAAYTCKEKKEKK